MKRRLSITRLMPLKQFTPGILLILLLGCGGEKSKESSNPKKSTPKLSNKFIIIGYSGPPIKEVNLERYQEIAESGIEILVPGNGTFTAEQNIHAMNLAEEVGLKIIPIDMRVLPFALKPEVSIDTALINAVVEDYGKRPSMAAYVLKDEPNAELFPSLGLLSKLFRDKDPIHEPVINLFPSYGSPLQLGFEDYRSYVSSFIELVEPEILFYDNYSLREGITWYDSWYSDLDVVREETRKARIPFVVFIQSEGIRGGLRVPNRSEILWQVNTALAYGARGIGWFCYWTPAPDQGFQQAEGAAPPLVESHYNAMIDISGRRTEVYDYVSEANFYLKKAGNELLDWENIGLARWESGIMLDGGSSPYVKPSGMAANLVIGSFRKADCNCIRIVVSNSSCEKPASFSLVFSEGWGLDSIFTSIEAERTGNKGELSQWKLEPGGSVILELVSN